MTATGGALGTPPCTGVCNVHPLMETLMSENRADIASMRTMFADFVQHAAEEHTKIREEILILAKTTGDMHKACIEARHAVPGQPHPHTRAEDYEERIALTLSRKDFWRLVIAGGILVFLLVGIALVAGREGLSIWGAAKDAATTAVVK